MLIRTNSGSRIRYNTNYVFWWPFDIDPAVVHDSIKYRFSITLA